MAGAVIDAMTDRRTLSVVTEPKTFTMNASGSVLGRIYLGLDGEYFPDDEWYDFPVPVLSWWIECILNLLTGNGDECELLFMDGPQFLHVAADKRDVWSVAFFRDLANRRSEPLFSPGEATRLGSDHKYEISAKQFVTSMLEAARVVIAECARRDWRSESIGELERLKDRLQAL